MTLLVEGIGGEPIADLKPGLTLGGMFIAPQRVAHA